MTLYEQNLQALTPIAPELSARLLAIRGNDNYEVFVDENDALKINLLHLKTSQTMYGDDPIEDVIEQHDRFEMQYKRYPMLYFYGVGNGVLLKMLLQNEEHKRIVVVESDIEILYIALNVLDFTKELQSGRILFFVSDQIDLPRAIELFSHHNAKIFVKTYNLEIMQPFYENNFSEDILTCNRIFAQAIEHVIYGLGNSSEDALIGIEHHLANAQKMVETVSIQEFVQHAKTTQTAVIAATGPSLKKQLVQLKKIQDYVTIFCIDASFPILEKEGIKPDVVLSMERVYETAKFYQETSAAFQEDVIFCLTSIVHPMLFNSIKAGTLQVSMRPFGYTRFFGLDDYGYAGIGMSAANLAFEYIFHSKFQQCILIGQDLAYAKDGTSHSDGHLFGENDKQQRNDDLHVTAYGGEGLVRTSVIWNMFKNFFESDVFHTSREGLVTINATEGGARIEGTVEMPFAKACETYVDFSHKKEKIVVALPDKKTVKKNKQRVKSKIAQMKSFAEKVYAEAEALFSDVAKACEILDDQKAYDNLEKVDYDHLAVLMGKIDDFKSYFENDKFIDIFIDATQALIVHQELELAKIQVRPVESDDDKRRKMIEWVYAHRSWLFSFAGIVHAVKIAIERSSEAKTLYGKVQQMGNFLDGFLLDLKDSEKQFEIDLLIDNKSVETIVPNLKKEHPVDRSIKSYRFVSELPEYIFDNQMHNIILREHVSGHILDGMPIKEVFLKDAVISGEAFSDNGFYFTGWVKKVGDNSPQKLDVIIDGMFIETIEANRENAVIQTLYGDDVKLGFEYMVLDEKYYDDKTHEIYFSSMETKMVLNSETREFVIEEKSIAKLREFKFIKSLKDAQIEKLKDLYCKDAIGLLAVEETFKELELVKYIKGLYNQFRSVKFKLFYFDDQQKAKAESIFRNELDRIEFIEPKNIYDVLKHIEVFVINYRVLFSYGAPYNRFKDLAMRIICDSENVLLAAFNSDESALVGTIGDEMPIRKGNNHYDILKALNISDEIIRSSQERFWVSIFTAYFQNSDIKDYTYDTAVGKFKFQNYDILELSFKYEAFKALVKKVQKLLFDEKVNIPKVD